ncbi:uncharacterized protein LOC122309873 [Carya illinoinensis]|uniref:uncharacterized protein LOC122309873 n=1 Tax=Carya illinoinensis TaxID=32201 RepID=UPI001C718442|nr:uncharacterized protein LOC122309873 [Carya illinoinensis]
MSWSSLSSHSFNSDFDYFYSDLVDMMIKMRFMKRAKRNKFTSSVPSESSSSEDEPIQEPVQLGETSTPPPPPLIAPPGATFEQFTNVKVKPAYRTTFTKRPVLGERELNGRRVNPK